MNKQNGIVLKTFFSKKKKIIILDAQLGKIEGVPPHDNLFPGALISYFVTPRDTIYFLQGIELLDVPMGLAKDDILFLHHILEVCYYGAPFEKTSPEIFQLVCYLYYQDISPYTPDFKIAFLFKLLVLLGMHPEELRFQDPHYYLLARESIDTIIDKAIQLETKHALHEWVRSCIRIHPLIHAFKTIHFLDSDRLL